MSTGTVKWFNPTKGYGFIQPTDGSRDVFVHISAVERAGLENLREGQKIQFELVHVPTDRMILRGVGSDAMGWFFVWDHQKRLWAHWNDRGTYVYMPDAAGRWSGHQVTRDSEFVRQVPPLVFDTMPVWVRQTLGLRRPARYARGGA